MSKIAAFYRAGRSNDPLERKIVRKLDMTFLPVMCLMYWSNYLNRTNYSFAYVSGMAKDIGMTPDDFTLGNTIFTVGYTVAQIPHAYLVTRLPARWYFPTCALVWGVLGCCLSAVTTPQQLWAIRFLIALFEAATFSGSHYLLASWYKEVELGKRASLFASSAQLGSLFSGVLQGAIYSNLNGVSGRAGWRWTYIIDGVVAIAIAFLGFAVFPSTPAQGGSYMFNQQELELAKARLPKREALRFTPRNVLRVMATYKYVGFSILFAIGSQLEAYGTNGIVQQWLQSLNRYPTSKLSYYSLGLTSVGIVATWIAGVATDIYGRRWLAVMPMTLGMLISAAIILAWNVPLGALFFAFYLGGIGYIQQGVFFAWANESSESDLQRAVTLFSMNLWSNALTAWYILLVWPARTGPRFQRGMISTLVIAPFIAIWASGLRYLEVRDRKKRRAEVLEHEAEKQDLPPSEVVDADSKEAKEEGSAAVLELDTAVRAPDDKF